MASMVAKASNISCSSQVSALVSVQEKGSRNKRKFWADTPLGDPDNIIPSYQNECCGYEFSAEKFEAFAVDMPFGVCDLCGVNQYHSEGLKLDFGLSSALGSSEIGTSQSKEELGSEESHDADWSDLTESQLEELVLSNLDAIFKSAIKNIVACGYTEDIATKAVLRSGLCYGRKDTVSNIVDSALAFLKNGQEIDPSREHCFEDLQRLEKYILAELVCALQEVRPFFSTGDAMWFLLICDMNVSHACVMNDDGFAGDGASNGTSSSLTYAQIRSEANASEVNLPNPSKPELSISCSQSDASNSVARFPDMAIPKNSGVLSGLATEKDGSVSTLDRADKSFSTEATSQSSVLEEKLVVNRKVGSNATKREYLLRHKSLHVEKGHRAYGTKASRGGKLNGLGGLILDKKLKSVSEAAISVKNASLRLSKVMGIDVSQDTGNHILSSNTRPSSRSLLNSETPGITSSLLKTNNHSALPAVTALTASPAVNNSPVLSVTDTDLSLPFLVKSNSSGTVNCNAETSNCSFTGIPYDKSLARWVPRDMKDEMIIKLVPMARELQNQLEEWMEWANQKVMQAARRLSKDKAELKLLRQEKEEVERLKKEKQTLEENTMKKLKEMENASCKASGQVDRANSTAQSLEAENAALRQEMEAEKLTAAQSAASYQEVSKREKNTLLKFQSWEKQKIRLQEELANEKRKVAQLQEDLKQAKELKEEHEARWKQEEKAKDELLWQANSITREREQIEASAKSKEDTIKSKVENNLQKYKDDIQKLEKEIAQLRLKTDSSKIAALRRGINESYASRVADSKHNLAEKEPLRPYLSEAVAYLHEHGMVKRERECVMCLSEEMSVVFLPCAHQVVCTTCNDLHEKKGMRDCPSCRSTIQQRISVRYAHP